MEALIETIKRVILLMPMPLYETLYMVFASTLFSVIFGMPLGIVTAISEEGHIWERKSLNKALNGVINIARSFPFIILMIAVFPITKLIVGKRIGTTAAIVPLTIAAIPFVARLIENAIKEISPGIIEAALSMGADVKQIVFRVLIPEALPSIASGITMTIINLVGYSAMAGAIGGGGLGNLAIRFGYQGFQKDVMIGTVIVLILMVQIIQGIGTKVYNKLLK